MKRIIWFYMILAIGMVFGALPLISNISISPNISYNDSTLSGYVNGTDADGDLLEKWC